AVAQVMQTIRPDAAGEGVVDVGQLADDGALRHMPRAQLRIDRGEQRGQLVERGPARLDSGHAARLCPSARLRARSGTLAHAGTEVRYRHSQGGATWSAMPYVVI